MPRVKRGTKRRARRKKILERASGYYLTKSKLYPLGERVGRARAEVRLQRPQAEEAPVPLHLDCAYRSRRQLNGPQLQRVHQWPEEGRHRAGPQDPCDLAVTDPSGLRRCASRRKSPWHSPPIPETLQ